MTDYNWKPFLDQLSKVILQSADREDRELPDDVVQSGWLGYPGAAETQITTAEQRLGKMLPPSYRQFLAITNGWRYTGNFTEAIWPVEKIERIQIINPALVKVWADLSPNNPIPPSPYTDFGTYRMAEVTDFKPLHTAIQISDWSIEEILLLNPETVSADGEWEAWFMAEWIPGANRYPSFWDLMQYEYTTLRNNRSQR